MARFLFCSPRRSTPGRFTAEIAENAEMEEMAEIGEMAEM